MNAVRRSEGLLSAAGFGELLGITAQGPLPASLIARIATARGVGSPRRAINSLLLLQEMELIEELAGGLASTPAGTVAGADRGALRRAVVAHYCALLLKAPLGSLFQRDPATDTILVDRILLPHRELGLPFLLVDLDILHRTGERAWSVAGDLAEVFLGMLTMVNTQATRSRPMSPAALIAWLDSRRAAGELAEAFALEFERRRLGGHPLLEQVRWVANEDVGAGFDIHAFDDLRSLALDRFIEVKGHGGDRAFHWSAGEIAAAQDKRQRYWLYLVDRRRLDEPGYEPEMYSDPYAYFIEDNPAGWLSEPSSFKFTAPRSDAGFV